MNTAEAEASGRTCLYCGRAIGMLGPECSCQQAKEVNLAGTMIVKFEKQQDVWRAAITRNLDDGATISCSGVGPAAINALSDLVLAVSSNVLNLEDFISGDVSSPQEVETPEEDEPKTPKGRYFGQQSTHKEAKERG